MGITNISYRLGYATLHQAKYDKAAMLLAESLEIYRARSDHLSVAACLAGFAALWRIQGLAEPAVRLLASVEAMLQSSHRTFPWPIDRIEYERSVAAVRAQLDEPSFNAAWEAGSTMTLEQAIEYALKEK